LRRGIAHNRIVAWMAVVAIWLTVLAPVVSRAMPAVSSFPDLGAWCEGSAGLVDRHAPAMPDQHADHMAQCGYCSLLSHEPGLSAVAYVAALRPSVAHAFPLPPARHATRLASLLAAAPRGPPAVDA
jgi:hypothetical protein